MQGSIRQLPCILPHIMALQNRSNCTFLLAGWQGIFSSRRRNKFLLVCNENCSTELMIHLRLVRRSRMCGVNLNTITLANKAYYANQFLFKSRLVSKKLKMKLYWRIIRSVVTYACETRVLKETKKKKIS